MMVFTKVEPTWNILFFPVVVFQVYFFGLGISLILAAMAVFFRDIQYLWGVFISIWMYLTPIIYPVSIIPDEYLWVYKNLNPMYSYVQQFRAVLLDGSFLPIDLFIQGAIWSLIVLILGIILFKRKQEEFILFI